MMLGWYNLGEKCFYYMYKNNDFLYKVWEGNGCIKKMWNMEYWYMYISSFLVNDVMLNGEGMGGNGGGGEKVLLFCDLVKMFY